MSAVFEVGGKIPSAPGGLVLSSGSGGGGTTATPTFSPVAGSYSSAQTVTISCSTPSSSIYYTTDGTTPTFPITGTTQLYTGTITVSVSETVKAIGVASGLSNSAVGSAAYTITSGATLEFSYPSGFASSGGQINVAWEAVLSGSQIELTTGAHTAGMAWYLTQQDVRAFTADFTINLNLNSVLPRQTTAGFGFVVQNSNATTNPAAFGSNAAGDANMCGFGAYSNQVPELNSVGIAFDLSAANNQMVNYTGTNTSAVMLAINGGAYGAFTPTNDISRYFSFWSGNTLAGNVVYDGTILTLTLKDTVTSAYYRARWPINIPPCMESGNLAWVGLTGGATGVVGGATSGDAIQQNLLTWDWYNGYNTILASPTFSVTPGQYSSTQSVSLSGPVGASIYYTTNGAEPTNLSSLYSIALSVSTNTIIKAISSQSGFTDSYTAVGNYQIQTSGTPLINFPSGFASINGLIQLNGYCFVSGSIIQMTDTSDDGQVSALWYSAQVGCGTFTSDLTMTFGSGANGMTFCLQNYNPTPSYSLALSYISGGINAIGNYDNGLGYSGTTNGTNGQPSGIKSSVCVAFNASSNTVGVFLNGGSVSSGGTSITGITLTSGHAMNIVLVYNGTTLSVSITDSVTTVNFSHTFTVDIPTNVGGSVAFVGVTGSSGEFSSGNMTLTKWTYATP
jgi:hypothetical protein